MKICCISDTHLKHWSETVPEIPECDILIHAGDVLNSGRETEIFVFLRWLNSLTQAKHKIFIAGNHDWALEIPRSSVYEQYTMRYPNIHYLCDSSVTIEGLTVYGSPWTPEFCNWAYMLPRNSERLKARWDAISKHTDILVTHGPPYGILDFTEYDQKNVGCELLLERVKEVKPKLHLFGHIHEGYGIDEVSVPGVKFVNASVCTLKYEPVNEPIVIEL